MKDEVGTWNFYENIKRLIDQEFKGFPNLEYFHWELNSDNETANEEEKFIRNNYKFVEKSEKILKIARP